MNSENNDTTMSNEIQPVAETTFNVEEIQVKPKRRTSVRKKDADVSSAFAASAAEEKRVARALIEAKLSAIRELKVHVYVRVSYFLVSYIYLYRCMS